ncbi:hypothetical protein GRF29_154g590402, partial [Pseudopithomyces chartarum]
ADRAEFQWLHNVQLIGKASSFHTQNMMNPIDESSFSDAEHGNIILSDVASWSVLDSDCFYMRDSVYRALDEDSSGDVIFPLHEKCVQLAYRVLDFRCGGYTKG